MASTSPDNDRLIGRTLADRYQITAVLGEGGMGRVYLAEHVRIGRRSAVKVLSPNTALSADAITRFNREAANAARINHPNVVQIYDFGETTDGVLYLAMEFVEGETLRAIVERGGPMAPGRAAALTRQIADALAAAHHLGIVHRDLKPDNIMVARHHDGSDLVKVVDFGIAKTVQGSGGSGAGSQTLTTAGVSLGTPEYMSPEQLAGEPLDSRTDLYSLGLVLFNMLTANLPYPKVTSRESLVRRLTSRPETLAAVAPQTIWPTALQSALDRALAPEAADRYASVVDFAVDVAQASASFEPHATLPAATTARHLDTTVRVVTLPEPVQRRRTNWRAPVIAAAATLFAVGAADTAYVAYRAREKPSERAATMPVPAVSPTTPPVATASPDTRPARTTPADTAPPPKPSAVVQQATARVARRPADDSDAERIRRLGEQLRGHAFRANQSMARGDVSSVRSELRELAEQAQTFREDFPAAADSLHLQQLLRAARGRIYETCRSAATDGAISLPPNFTCLQLLATGGRGRRGGRDGQFGRPRY